MLLPLLSLFYIGALNRTVYFNNSKKSRGGLVVHNSVRNIVLKAKIMP